MLLDADNNEQPFVFGGADVDEAAPSVSIFVFGARRPSFPALALVCGLQWRHGILTGLASSASLVVSLAVCVPGRAATAKASTAHSVELR